MKKPLILLIGLICSMSSYAQLIPAPDRVALNEGYFVLDANAEIAVKALNAAESTKLTEYLSDKIQTETGIVKVPFKKQ